MNRVSKIVHASHAYKRGFYGQKIGICVLDTGCFLHPDLQKQLVCFQDLCNGRKVSYDDNGHGTHVAGILCGNGSKSDGIYMGLAPMSHLVVLKVLDHKGNGNTSVVTEGIRWCITRQKEYGIRIMNISVGMLPQAGKREQSQLIDAVEQAWRAGIVVVAAAGNNGPGRSSVTIPGVSPSVITVGCSDDQSETEKFQMKRAYSGCGPTRDCIRKPEILAPGTGVVSCSNGRKNYEVRSGTSMATPVVSGCIALLLSEHPELTPAQVKLRLYQERAPLDGVAENKQGWGVIDLIRLM